MRTRTGITPDAWRDDGPQVAHLIPRAYSTVHADNVGAMRPVLTAGGLPFIWHGPKTKAMRVVPETKP